MSSSKRELKKLKNEIDSLVKSYPDISRRVLRASVEQYWFGEVYFSKNHGMYIEKGKNILEIGTAEGGLLKYFYKKGLNCYGVEINPVRFSYSQQLFERNEEIDFYLGDITSDEILKHFESIKFDIIVLRDVIEHIQEKSKVVGIIKDLLNEGGIVFLSFPSNNSPFAGHQQTSGKKIAKIPYFHKLPDSIYIKTLKILGVKDSKIKYLISTKHNVVNKKKLLEYFHHSGMKLIFDKDYFIRPEWKFRFGLNTIEVKSKYMKNFNVSVNGTNLVFEK